MGHHHDLVWGSSLPAGGCVEKQTPGLHWPRRLLHGAVSEGAIDGPRGDEGRLNTGRGSSNRRGGDSHTGDSQQDSCLESLIVSMHLLIVALI